MKAVAADAATVSVAVEFPATLPSGVAISVTRPDEDNDGNPESGFAAIEIAPGKKTGETTATVWVTDNDEYHHPRDKEVLLTLTASGYTQHDDAAADDDDDNVMLTVREDDQPIGALSLSANPPALSVGGNGTSMLTVEMAKAPGTEDGTDISVEITFTTEHSVDGSDGGSASAATIAGSAKSATSELSGVGVTAAGSTTVTASAVNYTPGTVTLEIIDRTADDVEGFRVTIATPAADGAWVGYGANKVKVHVTRLNAIAYSWTTFESVAVALRDTHAVTGLGAGDALGNIVTLTASGFGMDDDEVVFTTAALLGAETIAEDAKPDVIYKDKSITYDKANDRLIYSFALPNLSGADTATDSLGTLDNPSSARADDDADGRRMGVFARATFTAADGPDAGTDPDTFTFDSKDEKTKVFISPSALASVPEADRVVGDGKLLKLDLIQPANAVVAGIVTTVEGNETRLEGHNDHQLEV